MARLYFIPALLFCISITPLIAEPSSNESADAREVSAAQSEATQPEQEAVADTDEEEDVELVIQLGAPLKLKPADPQKTQQKQSISEKPDRSPAPSQKDIARNERQSRLSREALSFRGTRYVWGGESVTGFDCSGFTQYLYGKRGVKIPRTAKQQFKAGKPVDREDLQDGDLVFFNTRGPITHVGVYIGDGKFCHAANPRRGVTVNSLNDSYYGPRYAGARRYAKNS